MFTDALVWASARATVGASLHAVQAPVDVQTDSLLLRATFEPSEPTESSAHRRLAMLVASDLGLPEFASPDFTDLRAVSKILLGLDDLIQLARQVPEAKFAPTGVSEEGRRFLERQHQQRYKGRGYRLLSIEMKSPIMVVLELPPEAAVAFGFAVLALAERIATSQTRVSRRRAQQLRDKSQYDRERELIESGRLDMAARLLAKHPRPSTIEIVGGDETFDDAEPIESAPPDPATPDEPTPRPSDEPTSGA